LTSCIASLTDLAGAKFGTNIAGASLGPVPLTEAFVLTENSVELDDFLFLYDGLFFFSKTQKVKQLHSEEAAHDKGHQDCQIGTIKGKYSTLGELFLRGGKASHWCTHQTPQPWPQHMKLPFGRTSPATVRYKNCKYLHHKIIHTNIVSLANC